MKYITAELINFITLGVYKCVPEEEANDSRRRLIPTKFVFKKTDKKDVYISFKVRDKTLKFTTAPGLDLIKRFSPVATYESVKAQI